MICVHLQKLYQLCQQHELRLGAVDLVRIVCRQCGAQDVCPSTLRDEDEDRMAGDPGLSAPLIMRAAKVSIPAA